MSVDLLLASNSPRRRELLSLTRWTFEVIPVEIDEGLSVGEKAGPYVLRLAEHKAKEAAASGARRSLILAADTAVADGEDILGKPAGPQEAMEMLCRLRGRTHQVYTGIAVLSPLSGQIEPDLCITQVPMREYSPEEMEAYIASGDPFDKAGGYAIQNRKFNPVAEISGCYACVMGLPLCHLVRTMQKFQRTPPLDAPAACQTRLGYRCPIHQAVLAGEQVG